MSADCQFSVVIPTHNRAALLPRAIASVRAQTDADFEIVVVDDGSVDGTAELLAALRDERLRTLRNATAGGVSVARNGGARLARGRYLVFLDDDDALRPDALAQLRAHFAAHAGTVFAWGGRRVCEEDAAGRVVAVRDEIWRDASTPESPRLDFVLRAATNCAFTVERGVFESLGGFDESLHLSEDRDLFLRLVRAGHAGRALPRVLITVSEHFRDSLSRNAGAGDGPRFDQAVIAKHWDFLAQPRYAAFLNQYRRTLYAAFLRSGQRRAARAMLGELLAHGGMDFGLLQLYWRNAREIRALKRVLRYDRLRRWRERKRLAALRAEQGEARPVLTAPLPVGPMPAADDPAHRTGIELPASPGRTGPEPRHSSCSIG